MNIDDLMTLEGMSVALEAIPLYKVVEATGVTYPTLAKLRDQTSTNFTLKVLMKVSDYLHVELTNEQRRFKLRQTKLQKAGAI